MGLFRCLIRESQCRGTYRNASHIHTCSRRTCAGWRTRRTYKRGANGTWGAWWMWALNVLPAATHICRVTGNWTQFAALFHPSGSGYAALFPHSGLISTFLREHHLLQRVVDENVEQGLNKNDQCSHKERLLTVWGITFSLKWCNFNARCCSTFEGHLSLQCERPAAVPVISATFSVANIPGHVVLTATICIYNVDTVSHASQWKLKWNSRQNATFLWFYMSQTSAHF